MAAVLIIVDNEEASYEGKFGLHDSPTSSHAISLSLMRAIAAPHPPAEPSASIPPDAISLVSASDLSPSLLATHPTVCPLTLTLPDFLDFPGRSIYSACQDVPALRHRVQQVGACEVGSGNLWLPIVLTARGPLYGEVIGQAATPDSHQPTYRQPIHLADRWRQPLYRLGRRLLALLNAPPAVYLLQFGLHADRLCFDRLLPFPANPAIASIGTQTPDLFQCHWRCLTHQPVLDLTILPS